ncbi:methionine-R-sulfoxide reductase B3 isoform X3 [Motacilla alba alba]|uniref:methionine-R-sulfoxide reductase B3 isoform X3 n=1 Tax=Motacilla alba alba TaxID=1094192 RepID=UPI0018D50CE1|nr:methionine-R-sulfoxide reductase B3 isoform X3 [Motacilla alba alba]
MFIFGVGRRCPGISRHAPRAAGPSLRSRGAGGPGPLARSLGPLPCALRRRRCSPRSAWRWRPPQEPQLLPLFFASGFVGEDITVMSAFNLLHLVTKSQPVALRACGLPSVFRNVYHQRCTTPEVCSHGPKENKRSCRDKKDCKVVFSQEELRKRLTPLQYHVTQEKGTESAFEGEYTHHKAQGIYKCVVCGTPLFKSETKFDSNSGWPSFYDVISPDAIAFNDDFSYGMHRIEISCSQKHKHLENILRYNCWAVQKISGVI